MNNPIRVALIDDQQLVRVGIRGLLELSDLSRASGPPIKADPLPPLLQS